MVWLAHHRRTLALSELLCPTSIRMVTELDLLAEYDREIDNFDRRDQMLEAWAAPRSGRLQ
jgi:hypothetical protein